MDQIGQTAESISAPTGIGTPSTGIISSTDFARPAWTKRLTRRRAATGTVALRYA